MHCTTLFFEKRMVCRSLCLLVLVSLLCLLFHLPQEGVVWDRAWVPWGRGRRVRRRNRRPVLVRRVHYVTRRGGVLLCRLGLMAVLLVWSGWARRQPLRWALLSLPVVDAGLALLALYRPSVLKGRAYRHLMRTSHRLYVLALVAFFSMGLLSEGSIGGLWLIGGGVKMADGAWARGEVTADGVWRLEMKGHFIFTWQPGDFFEARILLVLLRQIRTPESTAKRPFLRQEWLAEWFGTHQELISRWQRYVREGGLTKLRGDYDGRGLTPQMCQASLEIWRKQPRTLTDKAERHSARGLRDGPVPMLVEPDTILDQPPNRVAWYHRNQTSIWPITRKHQSLESVMKLEDDPLLHRVFGGIMEGDGLRTVDATMLRSTRPAKHQTVAIYVLTRQPATGQQWLSELEKLIDQIRSTEVRPRRMISRQSPEQTFPSRPDQRRLKRSKFQSMPTSRSKRTKHLIWR